MKIFCDEDPTPNTGVTGPLQGTGGASAPAVDRFGIPSDTVGTCWAKDVVGGFFSSPDARQPVAAAHDQAAFGQAVTPTQPNVLGMVHHHDEAALPRSICVRPLDDGSKRGPLDDSPLSTLAQRPPCGSAGGQHGQGGSGSCDQQAGEREEQYVAVGFAAPPDQSVMW